MSTTGAASTEFLTIPKMFSWSIDHINHANANHLEKVDKLNDHHWILTSPEMSAMDPYTGVNYKGTLKLKFYKESNEFYGIIELDCKPTLGVYHCYYRYNNDVTITKGSRVNFAKNDPRLLSVWKRLTKSQPNIQKLTIFIDYVAVKKEAFNLNFSKLKGTFECLKELWKNDESVKTTLKSKDTEITAIKPFLFAHSPVFKVMFETEMKESEENFVEINDFEIEVIKKMVEFCETNNVKETEGFEADIFRIGHKYQMDELKAFAIDKMLKNVSKENLEKFKEVAEIYNLEDLKNWFLHFV